MKSSGNTILITGGGTGIGLALAARFLRQGNEVIICGRRLEKLREAQREHPGLHVHRCDISEASGRVDLFKKVTQDFPKLNVLFNNRAAIGGFKIDNPKDQPCTSGWYWSSSHCRFWLGWGLRFGTGCPDYYAEGNPARVRPVRSGPMPVKPPHPIKRPTGFNL